MPTTRIIRSSLVADSICPVRPTRIDTSPVTEAAIARPVETEPYRRYMPRANATSPTTRVKTAAAFSRGCGWPSEFREKREDWAGLLVPTVPAMTASRGLHRLGTARNPSPFCARRTGGRPESGSDCRWALVVLGAADGDSNLAAPSCHGETVAALVQRRSAHA